MAGNQCSKHLLHHTQHRDVKDLTAVALGRLLLPWENLTWYNSKLHDQLALIPAQICLQRATLLAFGWDSTIVSYQNSTWLPFIGCFAVSCAVLAAICPIEWPIATDAQPWENWHLVGWKSRYSNLIAQNHFLRFWHQSVPACAAAPLANARQTCSRWVTNKGRECHCQLPLAWN